MVTLRKLSQVPPAEIGSVYGLLTVVGSAEGYKRHRQWLVRCQCGSVKVVMDQSLRSGGSRSCGCLVQISAEARRVHGHATAQGQSKEYVAWRDMMQRCYNPKNPSYADYGGRGIKVDPKWHKFSGFLSDMGRSPEGLTLDRTNENRGYEKNNCTWATWVTQGRHRRDNRRLDFDGRTLHVADWARLLGMKPETIHGRLRKGWPLEKVLDPRRARAGSKPKLLTADGVTKEAAAWAQELGMPTGALLSRVRSGWPIEKAVTLPKGTRKWA